MANWNSGFFFNRKGNEQGFIWNTSTYFVIVKVSEVLKCFDGLAEIFANLILREQNIQAVDTLVNSALLGEKYVETLKAQDDMESSILFILAEQFGVKDEMIELAVLAYLNEKWDLLEQMQIAADIFASDDIKARDIPDVHAFLQELDDMGLKDLEAALYVLFSTNDQFGITDHEPRRAVSDFLIGAIDDDDRAYDWLIPFDLKIDWNSTKIQVMPEAENTVIEMPGMDGSIIADTTYKDRLFSIVAFSEEGLTKQQRETLKAKIDQILDATKHQTKKLTVQARSTSFDAKYDGQAEIVSKGNYVKATIPLVVGPYGRNLFDNELYGSGLIWNEGDTYLAPVHTITGPVVNPAFTLGTEDFVWNGTVQEGYTLIIDHGKMTCALIDINGKKTNGLAKLKGKFQKIDVGKSAVLNASPNTEAHIKTDWTNKVLW